MESKEGPLESHMMPTFTYSSAFETFEGSLDVLDISLVGGGFSKVATCFHCLIACPYTWM
jgi:hypothetical protein